MIPWPERRRQSLFPVPDLITQAVPQRMGRREASHSNEETG